MLRIAICDDEESFLEVMNRELEIALQMIECGEREIRCYRSGKGLLQAHGKRPFDIVFLDVVMPNLDGFSTASHLQRCGQEVLIVFVSRVDDAVYGAVSYRPHGYLRKDRIRQELPALLRNLIKIYDDDSRYYMIHHYHTVKKIRISEIIYIESNRNVLQIRTKDKEYSQINTMSSAEQSFKKYSFIRIHKGFLVNCNYISEMTKEEVIMDNDIHLPLSKTYKDSARECWLSYIEGMY